MIRRHPSEGYNSIIMAENRCKRTFSRQIIFPTFAAFPWILAILKCGYVQKLRHSGEMGQNFVIIIKI